MEITAAVLRDPNGPYTIEDLTIDDPAPDEVLVEVRGAGFCHTDLMPRTFGIAPIITGHEGAGVVVRVGADVSGVQVGDHVVLTFDSCGTCSNCAGGHPSYCQDFLMRNFSGRRPDGTAGVRDADGAEVAGRWFTQSSFATYALATERNVVVVDPELPIELLGPLGCSVQTGAGSILQALDVQPGSSVVISGAGAVGLAAVIGAVVAGAETIIAIDLHAHRLDLARELGATHTVDGSAGDLVGQIHALTGGGAEYALDTTGVPGVITQVLSGLRMTGRLGLVGVQQGDLVLDVSATYGKTIMGIFEGDVVPATFIPRMIQLWQDGRFPFDRLITTFPLEQINEAEQASLSGEVVKPVLTFGASG